MARPRLFYVLGSLEANDTGDEIVTILGRLSRARFEPRVIGLGGSDELRERIARMKVRVYPLGLSGPLGALLAVWKVRSLLKSMDAEVVHGFGAWGGAVAALAAPAGVSVVRSVSRPPVSGSDLRGWILGLMERRAAKRDGIHYLVPDEAAREMVANHYGGGETTVVPTSIDVAGLREAVRGMGRDGARLKLGIAPDETVFACLTPFHSGFAMDEILQGLAVARREHPGIRLFLVGSGRHEGSSRWKAEELRLDDAVVFLGRGPEAESIWAAADVVVDAYPWKEWSRGALKGQAAGLPVVKRVNGIEENGLEADDGMPLISGQADRFGSGLVRLADDAALRERIRASQTQAAAGHDVAEIAERLAQVYQSQRD
ncbi:MAG: glycosyltransferase family 4 protein [Gemmatimonadota bacterium]